MLILLLATLIGGAPEEGFAKFCEGYRFGYRAGYCSGHAFFCNPPPPACPVEEGTWNDGYQKGFDFGLRVHGCGHEPCKS